MPIVDAFRWTDAGTTTLSATDSSQSTAVKAGSCVEVNNPSSTVTIFLEHKADNTTATANTTTSYPVMPGHCKIFRMPDGVTNLAYIGSAAGPTTFYITNGEGV